MRHALALRLAGALATLGAAGCNNNATDGGLLADLSAAVGGAAPDLSGVASMSVGVRVGRGMTFAPSTVNIHVGDTVIWTWAAPLQHSVTSGPPSCAPDGTFDSGIQAAPFTFIRTFTAPGTVQYFCSIHCASGMTGTITVQ
jgi:plastocyanin